MIQYQACIDIADVKKALIIKVQNEETKSELLNEFIKKSYEFDYFIKILLTKVDGKR